MISFSLSPTTLIKGNLYDSLSLFLNQVFVSTSNSVSVHGDPLLLPSLSVNPLARRCCQFFDVSTYDG